MRTIAREQIFPLRKVDIQEATQGAQDEGDFVRCPGHFGFSSWSFTKSAGFIHLL